MRRRDTRQRKQDVPHVNRLAGQSRATRLVINADDFGYFDQVSRGIVEAAERELENLSVAEARALHGRDDVRVVGLRERRRLVHPDVRRHAPVPAGDRRLWQVLARHFGDERPGRAAPRRPRWRCAMKRAARTNGWR